MSGSAESKASSFPMLRLMISEDGVVRSRLTVKDSYKRKYDMNSNVIRNAEYSSHLTVVAMMQIASQRVKQRKDAFVFICCNARHGNLTRTMLQCVISYKSYSR